MSKEEPKRLTIGLMAIMRNEEDNIGRMLSSVMPYVDKAVIVDTNSTDKSIQIAKNFKAQVIEVGDKFVHPLYEDGIPIFNFDEAKNFAMEQLDTDYILWLDADDQLINGQNIPKILELMQINSLHSMFFRYIYFADIDERGQIKKINIEHLRERIFKNDGTFKWVGKLHETLIAQRPILQSDNKDMLVLHHTNMDEMEKALYRNIVTLQEVVNFENGRDPRNVYYLGKTYFDMHDSMLYDYTIGLLKQYLETSGWAEERAQGWTYLSYIHLEKNEVDDAIRAGLMSFYEDPKFPDSYIILGLAYLQKQDWQKALHWARLASLIEIPKTTLVITPIDLQVRVLDVIFHACLNTGQFKESEGAVNKLLELIPDSVEFKERKKLMDEIKTKTDLVNSIVQLVTFLQQKNDQVKLRNLFESVPEEVASAPALIGLRNQVLPPRTWGNKEVVIYCGPGFEKWSPLSIEQGGLGGSESAVIYLSRELAKLGYSITVYADPPNLEIDDQGVIYKPYFYFNQRDQFNILIVWRNPGLFDFELNAKKIMIWNHDIINPFDYTNERLSKMDKILCLSNWQAESLKNTKAFEKVYITRNGIPLI